VIPDKLAAAPRWIYRDYSTGMVAPTQGHPVQYTLQRHGDEALLIIERLDAHPTDIIGHSPMSAMDPPSPRPTANNADRTADTDARSFKLGTITTNGATSTITFNDDDEPLVCTPGKVRVAGATAGRAGDRSKEPDCGFRGRWVPATLRTIEVLRCNLLDDPDVDHAEEYAFAPAPGIEFLYINDDCDMQGGGYRAIAKDGAIAPPRASRRR
jgi:hypothetical protein